MKIRLMSTVWRGRILKNAKAGRKGYSNRNMFRTIGVVAIAAAAAACFALVVAASGGDEWSARMADEVFVGARYGIAVDGPSRAVFTIQATNGTLKEPIVGRTNPDGKWVHTLSMDAALMEEAQQVLGGKNLACWCPLGHPCHADVLLEVANANEL